MNTETKCLQVRWNVFSCLGLIITAPKHSPRASQTAEIMSCSMRKAGWTGGGSWWFFLVMLFFCIFFLDFFFGSIASLLWQPRAAQPFGSGPDGSQAQVASSPDLSGTNPGWRGNPIAEICACRSFSLACPFPACWLCSITWLSLITSHPQGVVPLISVQLKKQGSNLHPSPYFQAKVVLLTFPFVHETTLLCFWFPHGLWAESSKPNGREIVGSSFSTLKEHLDAFCPAVQVWSHVCRSMFVPLG